MKPINRPIKVKHTTSHTPNFSVKSYLTLVCYQSWQIESPNHQLQFCSPFFTCVPNS